MNEGMSINQKKELPINPDQPEFNRIIEKLRDDIDYLYDHTDRIKRKLNFLHNNDTENISKELEERRQQLKDIPIITVVEEFRVLLDLLKIECEKMHYIEIHLNEIV